MTCTCLFNTFPLLCSRIDYEEDFEADDEDAVEKPSSVANDEVKETESRDEHDQSENNKESDSEVEDASTSS